MILKHMKTLEKLLLVDEMVMQSIVCQIIHVSKKMTK